MEYTIKNYAIKSMKDILDDRPYSDEMKLKYSTQIADDIRDKLSLKKKTHTNFVGIYLFNTLGTFAVNFRSNFSDKTDYNIIIPYQNK